MATHSCVLALDVRLDARRLAASGTCCTRPAERFHHISGSHIPSFPLAVEEWIGASVVWVFDLVGSSSSWIYTQH